jgi:lipopolysaccharide cholinephosphotransferase
LHPNETEESLMREVYANIYTSLWSMELDDLFPLKKYKFEDSEFYGPKNGDKILRHWYGDKYMELPPEDKRVAHFDSVKFID